MLIVVISDGAVFHVISMSCLWAVFYGYIKWFLRIFYLHQMLFCMVLIQVSCSGWREEFFLFSKNM